HRRDRYDDRYDRRDRRYDRRRDCDCSDVYMYDR
ncbi:MAG TPA: PepSY domain-containing protein, partial [Brevundimonas sp.]|nr:PepSY domain-containing protein [Brevundimonas sp.]